MNTPNDRPVITPSELGEYVKYGSCPRYAKLRADGEDEQTDRDWKEAFNTLNPLLSEEGRQFEDGVYDDVRQHAHDTIEDWRDYEYQDENDETLREAVIETAARDAGDAPLLLMQAHFAGNIGAFFVPGDSDLIVIWPGEDNHVHIRVFDIKASFEEKTYHQIQTSCYTILFDRLLDHSDITEAGVTYDIDAGIIYRESDWSALDADTLPFFNPEPREADVRRLLATDGNLHNTFRSDLDDIDYQLDSACQTCPFNESCFTRSIEGRHIRLLGLTRGEQAAFKKVGLTTLDDVAELIDPLDDPRPYQYDEPDIRPQYQNLAQRLNEEHSIGESLPRLAQKAQALLGELNEDHPDAHDAGWLPWIQGSGDGSLPEDDPPFDMDMEIERGSLIRVYLNVQWDYLRDRIAVFSGRVTSSNYNGTPLTFGTMMTEQGISDDEDDQAEDEQQLLETGFKRLFKAIRTVANMAGTPDEAPVHLYFFGRGERDALMDAVKRHPSLSSANAVRDLLGLRAGIDQAMVSVVQEEVEQRMAVKSIGTGILPIMDHFYPSKPAKMEWEDWKYERQSGETVNLRDAFYRQLFDYRVPYEQRTEGIRMLLGDERQSHDIDGYYPSRGRFGAEVPLEYIWAAEGIDVLGPGWTDDPQYKGIIEYYRWHSKKTQDQRITREDIIALSKKFAHALHHVERGIKFKNANMDKKPIPLPDIDSFSLGESSLAQACREYLDLEYATSKQDLLSLYRKPLKERILDGQSVPVRIESFTLDDGFLHAKAKLIVDEFDFGNPERVAMATRVKGSDEGTTGSWMVATPLRALSDGSLVQSVGRPDQIQHASPVTVQSIDPRSGDVELVAFPDGGKKDDDYRTWHKRWTHEDGGRDTYIAEGEMFILDPQPDDMTSERASNALDHADSSSMYNLVQDIARGNTSKPTTDVFNEAGLEEYVEWCKTDCTPSPNPEQRGFIGEGDAQVSLLQGPPGTGKTSGALSHAILARAHSFNKGGKHLRALVSGASNKAVDELLDDVVANLQQFNETHDSDALDDVMLVRFVGDKPKNPLPGVEYINYHEDEVAMQRLEQRLQPPTMRQTTLTETGDSEPHVIVFSTPSRVSGFMGKHSMFGGDNNPYAMAPELFDVFAADEASMLPLPQFFLAGAFTTGDGQLLIGGDQRQMPPVQKHDWNLEDRRTIEQVAPYLSTLDYFRLLRGDAIDGVEDAVLEQSPHADIPISRLQETYRCHSTVAEFLRRWVYSKDDINYQSSLTYTIPAVDGATPGLDAALKSDRPLTLILHDDATSQQSNFSEAKMAQKLVEGLPKSETLGIVTPHNSQKGLLSAMCDPQAHVDTVERFQGGQRDVMLLSATVSDPDYLDAESDFILNLNRLNVALSRMKKKLIVIAPKTLFNVLPGDIDEYEDSIIWKGLYSEVNADGPADWEGTLADFTGDDRDDDDVTLWVYGK